jgi:hypothetical protein
MPRRTKRQIELEKELANLQIAQAEQEAKQQESQEDIALTAARHAVVLANRSIAPVAVPMSAAAEAAGSAVAAVAAEDEPYVYLTCVKSQGKLRVRITTPGYLTTANCQFPRDLRVEGRHFRVKPSAVKLMTTRNKYYYCVKNAKDIEIVQHTDIPKQARPTIMIYQDTEQEECLICYDAAKESVFNPCGHFYTCHACSVRCKTCPVCRHPVLSVIDKNELE